MHLKIGKTLQDGKYRIEDVLGQGGFGITYLALHTTLERKVAIKEFFMSDFCSRDVDTAHVTVPSLANKEKVAKCKAKFIKEARNIARLDNPHIIRIHDVFEENDTAYYVMEHIDGQSLKDVLPPGKTLTETVALDYIRQVSEALAEVHANGLLHLDIKPGNIMVDTKGRAVLIDFGVSKRFDDGSGNEQLTTTTMLGYTPGYAPLEQMDQDGSELTPASDIYALGATLYRLLSGETPPAATALARRKHLEPLPESVSPSVRNAVNKAMQIDEEKRPQTVADFLALLDAPSSAVPENDVTIHDGATEHEDDTEKNDKTDNNINASRVADSKPVVVEPEKNKSKLWLWILIALLGLGVGLFALFVGGEPEGPSPVVVSDTDSVQATASIVPASTPYVEQEDATAQVAAERVAELQAESLRIAEERRLAEEAERKRQEEESVPRTVTAIDLGLSVKWADRNVGADSPEDYGDYFAWGETEPKSIYYWDTYKWCNGWYDSMTKYCTDSDCGYNGFTDGKTTLELSDDAAYVNMGSNWCMPTYDQFSELESECSWISTTQKGVEGYTVTGPNGKSIFLPAADLRYDGSYGNYWSSSLYEGDPRKVWTLYFSSDNHYLESSYRQLGLVVRAVVR